MALVCQPCVGSGAEAAFPGWGRRLPFRWPSLAWPCPAAGVGGKAEPAQGSRVLGWVGWGERRLERPSLCSGVRLGEGRAGEGRRCCIRAVGFGLAVGGSLAVGRGFRACVGPCSTVSLPRGANPDTARIKPRLCSLALLGLHRSAAVPRSAAVIFAVVFTHLSSITKCASKNRV